MKNLLRNLAALTSLPISIISCNSGSTTPSSANTIPPTITVPLTYTLQGESMGLHMPISVGNNQIYVGIDTGSVGLRVLESSLSDMSNITLSSTKESYAYADGVHVSGVLASAPITIGGVSETIKFMLIENVDCLEAKPDCPKASFVANGRAGLMGVMLGTGGTQDGIWSPLGQLPGNLSSGFIVIGYTAAPNMIIGLTPENSQNFSYVGLNTVAQPGSNPAPYPLWDVVINSGISFPQPETQSSLSMQSESGLAIYDTGTSNFTVYNIPESQNGLFESNGSIHMYQTLSNGNNFTWGFTSGSVQYVNQATKSSESSPIIVNTGNTPFTQLDILYSISNGSIGFRQHNTITQESQTTQAIFSDDYNCFMLPVCSSGTADLTCVSPQAYQRCQSLQTLSQSGVTLNDSNNLYIFMFQQQVGAGPYAWPMWMSIATPTTLFAGFTITYNPDPTAVANKIGWPVESLGLQQEAYLAGNGSNCLAYTNNGEKSYSPWLSHCSTFTEWAESQVFSVQVPPAQPRGVLGYDWCGLANENNADLINGNNGWASVTDSDIVAEPPVAAQILANLGCAVVVNYKNTAGSAGHIAVVLPSTYQVAQKLQQGSNYPRNVLVNSSSSFEALLNQVGPEEMQAGLYNFQHTVVYNGFFSELSAPQDYTSIVYFYNQASCPAI